MLIDWPALIDDMTRRFALPLYSIHGPEHWERVGRHAVVLGEQSGGDLVVVRLFAAFHDVCRRGDHHDDRHGARGAELATLLRGDLFDLTDTQFDLLHYACTWHTAGLTSDDPTIGACWDADRLDLWRAGIPTAETFMSTAHGRELARTGQVGPQYTPAPRV